LVVCSSNLPSAFCSQHFLSKPILQTIPYLNTNKLDSTTTMPAQTLKKTGSKAPGSATAAAAKATPPVAHAINGASPFEIMASRIANRVAEMAENVTFAERPVP
jgi:hypothetical protein